MKKFILSCSVLIIFNLVCFSQNVDKNEIDVAIDECLSNAKEYKAQTACYKANMKKWDAEIEKYSKKLSEELYLDTKELVDRSHQTWSQYKKYEFEAIEDMLSQLNGDFYDMMEAKAKMNIVRGRALELGFLYQILHQP